MEFWGGCCCKQKGDEEVVLPEPLGLGLAPGMDPTAMFPPISTEAHRAQLTRQMKTLDDVVPRQSFADDDAVVPMTSTCSEMTKRGNRQQFRADFPNAMIDWTWPYISEYVCSMISSEVEPAMKKALGSFGSSFTFDQTRCNLGDKPVQLLEMEAHETVQRALDGDVRNVTISAQVEWDGHLEVVVNIAKVQLGVKRMTLHGIVTMDCVGMQARPPMFEGVRMYFVNPPEIDLEFTGHQMLNKILNFSSTKQIILSSVSDQLAKRLVVPNRVGKLLMREADMFKVMRPIPDGLLEFSVLRAENLLAKDINFFSKNTSDPYVLLRSGAYRFRSKTHTRTLSPTFNFSVHIVIADPVHQKVYLQIFDEDKFSQDDILGSLEIPVASAMAWGRGSFSFDLEEEETRKNGKPAKVWLRAEWKPIQRAKHRTSMESDYKDHTGAGTTDLNMLSNASLVACKTAFLFVGIYSASHVPKMVDGTKFWCEVDCTHVLGDHTPTAQITEKLEQHGKAWNTTAAQTTASVEEKQMARKLELLRQYNVSDKHMLELLEIDPSQLHNLHRNQVHSATTLHWDHGFEFVISDASSAVLTFKLMCIVGLGDKSPKSARRPSSGDEVRKLGTYDLNVSELLDDPKLSLDTTVLLGGTSIRLRLNLQVRFVHV